jgi:hypothetical protein
MKSKSAMKLNYGDTAAKVLALSSGEKYEVKCQNSASNINAVLLT